MRRPIRSRALFGISLLILNVTLLTKFIDDGNTLGITTAVIALVCATGMVILPETL